MTSPKSETHVAVLGGGILGVSTAVHLLRSGASVVLITEGELSSGATGRSLSWLNSAGKRSDAYHHLRMAGIDRYRTLFAADPTREWLQFGGGLFWAPAGDAPKAEARHEYEQSHGYDSVLVKPEQISALTPAIDATAVSDAAVFNPGEGWVSLPHLVAHLMEEFRARGGELVTNAGKSRVLAEDGKAAGIVTEDGTTYAADRIVVACGAATPGVVEEHGVYIADASPVSALVITEPAGTGLKAVLNTPRAAVRPNPGGGLALDHSWYEEQIVEAADGTFSLPDDVVGELTEEASRLLEGNPQLTAASCKVGRKPVPGDGEPVFGELEKLPGCFVAFSHSGATVGLIAGELLSFEIVTGQKHPMLETFRPERFSRS
ncbi:glycine/D-amino acid oxidase-like deaminating enzyme [Pseudarthrobacter sp. W1I19]|uniref:NAD(P)/FAD-dependent oxidoreductase n=1 Tax=Pseudarthrobacter sp. W1I19 TaxID=3042288 RepID=UPI0027854015|nr:FAD-binding oxidoreductase [Pseudarthrobacter sp. W1I19]MDQ0921785.1 glycine/D-amino acid oxidase-like deaminating enzyme [Pseudarthrobacter sp. W1I19]